MENLGYLKQPDSGKFQVNKCEKKQCDWLFEPFVVQYGINYTGHAQYKFHSEHGHNIYFRPFHYLLLTPTSIIRRPLSVKNASFLYTGETQDGIFRPLNQLTSFMFKKSKSEAFLVRDRSSTSAFQMALDRFGIYLVMVRDTGDYDLIRDSEYSCKFCNIYAGSNQSLLI